MPKKKKLLNLLNTKNKKQWFFAQSILYALGAKLISCGTKRPPVIRQRFTTSAIR